MNELFRDPEYLKEKAKQLRRDIVSMIYGIKSGHPGGSLSSVEILTALYYCKMRNDPRNPQWADRDRFILSKGHCAPVLYAVLSDRGFFDRERLFDSFRRIGGMLQGHPDMKKTPGVDMTTGSLGIGLSAACGMALGARMMKKDFHVYVLVGDGELNEGQIWEAAKTAAHYKLDNLTCFIDSNGYQNDGPTDKEMNMEPIDEKWRAFGWNTLNADGHDMKEILDSIDAAIAFKGKPTAIICRTVKCKGISYMEEDKVKYHGTSPNEEQYIKAMEELSDQKN